MRNLVLAIIALVIGTASVVAGPLSSAKIETPVIAFAISNAL